MKKLNPVILTLIMGICFSCAHQGHSEKNADHYKFGKIEQVNSLGKMRLKLKEKKIIISADHSKITAPLRYKDDNSKLNFNNIYRLTPKNGKTYLFRFGWISYKDGQTVLSDVIWLRKKPTDGNRFKTYTVETVKIPFVQKGSLKICTIGDSQTWWKRSGKLRTLLNKAYPDFYFVGSDTDRFGYPHEGEGGNSTGQVLERIEKIPRADYYTLLLGTNDWKKGLDQAVDNMKEITTSLLRKYPESNIIYLTPLPTTNRIRDDFNIALANQLKPIFKKNKRIETLDLREKFSQNPDWAEDYLRADGLHPSRKGVELMAETIAAYFKTSVSPN